MLDDTRWQTLQTLDELLDRPLNVLSFVWLALLLLELLSDLPPWVGVLSNAIWAVFWIDFLISLTLAPDKGRYLRRNWLTVLSLLLPALRLFRALRAFRVLRAARFARGTRLVQILTRLNRSLRTLQRTLQRRQFGLVMTATALVLLIGSAGMLFFEGEQAGAPRAYSEWLYWTGMLLSSLGSDYWPRTGEGRVLTLLLAVYGFTVFGYITAALASFFVGADNDRAPDPEETNNAALLRELRALREELARQRAG